MTLRMRIGMIVAMGTVMWGILLGLMALIVAICGRAWNALLFLSGIYTACILAAAVVLWKWPPPENEEGGE